jgi:hypothetical protein
MYEGGKGGGGAAGIVGGAIVLPNTGGNVILQIVALTSIVVGSAIVLSTLIRLVAKRAYKA